MTERAPFVHPVDTPLSAGLRFATELIAWVSAAVAVPGGWAVPALVVLVGVPALCSTPGDKRLVLLPTPGAVRVAIEAVLFAVAWVLPWWVWSQPLAALASVTVAVAACVGLRRWRWLLRGAVPA